MKEYQSYIYCLIAILFFSTHEVVGKFIDSSITPIAITFYRFIIGGILIFIFVIINNKKYLPITNINYILKCSLIGALNVCISMFSLQLGIYYGQATFAAIIIGSNPIFVSIFAHIILKEKLTLKTIICIIIGILGMGLVILGKFSNTGNSKNPFLGILFSVIASVTFALYTVLSKQQIKKSNIHYFNSISFIAGSFLLLILGLIFKQDMSFSTDFKIIFGVLYLGIIVTCLAYFLLFEGIRHINASIGSSFFFLKPVFASVFAYFLLKETLNFTQQLGIIIVIGALFFNTFVKRKSSIVPTASRR